MKLGRAIDTVRTDGAYEAHRSRFEALGLTFDRWNEPQYPFALVRQALESFHGRYGHYEVPMTYVVAADDAAYAVPVRGMKLGQIVSNIIHEELYAEHRGELEAMGVPLKPRKELKVDRICEAVRCYRREYGEKKRIPQVYKLHHHANVPQAFVVPAAEEPWPRELHGDRLGRRVDYLRVSKKRLSPAQVEQLDNAGMVWSNEEYRVDRIERGLTTYKAMYGDVRIPSVFVVPHGDGRWDRDLWDMKLGSVIDTVRNNGVFEAHRSRFEALGLTFDRWNEPQYPFALVRQALESFYGRYGHYEVPQTYVVAADDAAYAEPVRGMKLGQIVNNIIHDERYAEHRGELEAMGVPLKPRKELMADRICEAVRCYRREYGEKKRIPQRYKVPEESSSYPRELWGLALGRAVYNICKRGGYVDYRDRFEAVGLDIETSADEKEASS
eukprot:gene23361-biopygen8384